MKTEFKYPIFCAVLIMALLCGCGMNLSKNESSKESIVEGESIILQGEEAIMTDEVKELIELVDISEYAAESTLEILHELPCPEIDNMELISDQYGYTIKVTDIEDHVYYLGLGGLGYLELIRKDSLDGEIVYAEMDD